MTTALKLTYTVPVLRLVPAMPDPEDTRETTTLAPDTDRGNRDTEPPGDDDARLTGTMIPPGQALQLDAMGLVLNPQDMPSLLYNQLMRVHQDQLKRDVELFEPEGRFAQLQREQHRQLVIGFKEATAAALEPKIDELANELRAFSQTVTEKYQAQDTELGALRRELETQKGAMVTAVEAAVRKAVEPFAGKLEALEQAVDRLEANDRARQAAPATPQASEPT